MGHQTPSVTKALRLVAEGLTPYAAAKKTGIALSTIYRALKRHSAPEVPKMKEVATPLNPRNLP